MFKKSTGKIFSLLFGHLKAEKAQYNFCFYVNKGIFMKSFLTVIAFLFVSFTASAGYRVANDVYGNPKCFPTDRNGVAYGTSVPQDFCAYSYRAWPDLYNNMKCFSADQHGKVFGTSVSNHLCLASYRAASDIYGYMRCFMADPYDKVYGTSVPDHLCQY